MQNLGCRAQGLGSTIQGFGFATTSVVATTRSAEIWEFPKIGDPYFGVLIIGILSFRVLY